MIKFITVEQYKNSSGYSIRPQISGKNIIWHHQKDNKDKIFFYDGNKTVEIYSANINTALSPRSAASSLNISEDYVVWSGINYDGKRQVFFYDGQEKIQIMDNHGDSGSILFPQISGNNIVRNSNVAYFFENIIYSSEIFLDNGKDIIKLTNGERVDAPPKLSGDNIVWSGFDSQNRKQIFFYNGKKVIQLTKNNDINNSSPQVKATTEKATWQDKAFIQNSKTFFDRSNKTIQLTRTYNPIFGEDKNDKYRSDKDDYTPQISDKNIVWETKGDLFLYNGDKIIRLDDKNREVNGFSLKISDDNVAWTADNSDGGREVFLYNGNETIQLTNNDIVDTSPQISGNYTVWQSNFNLFAYDGSKVIHLAESIGGRFLHFNPKIDGNKIVWQKNDLLDGTISIMLATLDRPQSSYLIPIDGTPQIITSSAIAILGLIFVYLLKKLIADS